MVYDWDFRGEQVCIVRGVRGELFVLVVGIVGIVGVVGVNLSSYKPHCTHKGKHKMQ